MVRFARHEYARTVEDVLARRCRLLFLDAAQAARAAPAVAAVLQDELGREPAQASFEWLAAAYAQQGAAALDRPLKIGHNRRLRQYWRKNFSPAKALGALFEGARRWAQD
jgi:hypothetical protein